MEKILDYFEPYPDGLYYSSMAALFLIILYWSCVIWQTAIRDKVARIELAFTLNQILRKAKKEYALIDDLDIETFFKVRIHRLESNTDIDTLTTKQIKKELMVILYLLAVLSLEEKLENVDYDIEKTRLLNIKDKLTRLL